jgi:hypothetical protein
MDQTSFNDPSTQLAGKGYQCSKCGQTCVYDKPDH